MKVKYTKQVGAIIFSSFMAFGQLSFAQSKAKTSYEDREREREKSEEILERSKFELKRVRVIETGKVPEKAYWKALLETKQAKEFYENTNSKMMALSWTERGPNTDVVGPSNGNTRANSGITSGRIRATHVDLNDATGKTVWVGGVDGGLWKTTDITASPASWVLVNDYLSNLAVSDICQDPVNKNILYFCTGEAYFNVDAVSGAGVFKSTDNGATWSLLSSTSAYTLCSRILCDYLGNVYLGTNGSGLLRSTDGGSTWTTITPSGMSSRICDLEISSTTAAGRLHVVGGIFSTQSYRYTDVPTTVTTSGWTAPTTAFPSYSNRAEIACSGNTLFACPSDNSYQVPTIYKSTNGGATWTATGGQPTSGWASQQGWYALAVGIDPSNVNNCIVGGLDAYKTTNGGTSWVKISNWVGTSGQYVHADIHDIAWYDNGNKLLFACDGGIHYSTDKGTVIRDRNAGLRIKQFYSVAMHPTTTNYFLAGAQDNGVHKLTSAGLGGSVEVTGGDGAFVAIDQDQPTYQFGSYVYNQYRRSTDGGNTWTPVDFSSTPGSGQFINPFDYDNVNNILYAASSAGRYLRWSNPQTGSTSASVTIAGLNSALISNVKVSPYTSHRVFFGTESGRLVRVDGANLATPTSNTNITSASMPAGYVSCINIGTNDQNLIASYSNYGVNNIWISSNGGSTWTTVDGNLPDMPVRWCMFNPGDNTKAIIATETGVWETTLLNGASTAWTPSLNFPTVRTDMLAYRASDGTLAAATHGRGIFSTILSGPAPTCGTPTGLASASITSSSATVSWTAVSGAASYDVDYKLSASGTWTSSIAGTTSTSRSITGLAASSTYDWRVRTNCTGASSAYAQGSFTTTAAASACPGTLDVSTNGTIGGAATAPFNTDIKGTIGASGDIDFYKVVITTGGTATITLGTLPFDYDVKLFASNGTTQLGISQAGGTSSETITYTFAAGTYYVQVYGYQSANSATSCYTLKVQLGTASKGALGSNGLISMNNETTIAKIYPNPVKDVLYVSTLTELNENSNLQIMDATGKILIEQKYTENPQMIDIKALKAGLYLINLTTASGSEQYRFVKEQ
jgi:trimeric autotransporter adhesin